MIKRESTGVLDFGANIRPRSFVNVPQFSPQKPTTPAQPLSSKGSRQDFGMQNIRM